MGHLQRLLDRASGATPVIRPRLDPWSPASPVPDENLAGEPELMAPVPHSTSASSGRHPETSTAPHPETATTPPAPRAVHSREPLPAADQRAREGWPDADPAQPVITATATATGPGPEAHPTSAPRVGAEPGIGAPAMVAGTRATPSPRLDRDVGRIETTRLETAANPRTTITPLMLPGRRPAEAPREPDVIISIGRIEVRAPAAPARPTSRPAAGETDAERHQRYIRERVGGRPA